MALEALTGQIEERELEKEMRSSYLDYAMSVIVGRALPDVRDGLKPVHRRVLYAMHDIGLQPTRPYRKCAFIVGEVMGKYHPHGDSAIYDTLVRMAQEFSLRYTLVDGQGNFGSIDDDPAAAMRYTEARLGRLATELLRDIDADTVDFGPNYDESTQEPLILPARFPNLLVNGASGIAVGMATNIPPHNLREVAGAVTAYIDDPDIDLAGLMEHVKGPDFPGGGIMSLEGIRDAYASGRGTVKVRARAHVEPLKGGKDAIVVTELPFMVKKGGDNGLITKIADLVRDKKLEGISDLRDESDRSGMRLVIELKRGGHPAKVVLNNLYKKTGMQTSFGINMVALVDGVPRTLGLRELVEHYVQHQREVVTRRTQYELRRAEARAHILEGLLIALDNLDAVIKLIRGSADPDAAREGLIAKFELSREQAQAILDMRLQRLTALEADKVRAEHADLIERIGELRAILGDEARVLGLVKEELAEIVESYGDERRTEIAHFEGDVGIEDMIADQQMVISLTASGYVKRLPLRHLPPAAPRRRRGDGDEHEGGRLHRPPPHLLDPRLPALLHQPRQGLPAQGLRAAGGLADGERQRAGQPAAAARRREGDGGDPDPGLQGEQVPRLRHRQGPDQEDRVPRLQHADPRRRDHRDQGPRRRRAGPGAADLGRGRHPDGLPLRATRCASPRRQVRPMGRDTSGVKGMNVSAKVGGKPNRVLAMDVARDDTELFVVTENGYGKRTSIAEYPRKGRGTKGVLTAKLTEKKGGLAGALIVREHQELLFISQNGMVQRTSASGISRMGRPTQGVKVMNIKDDDRVSAVALVVESDDSAPAEDAPPQDELAE